MDTLDGKWNFFCPARHSLLASDEQFRKGKEAKKKKTRQQPSFFAVTASGSVRRRRVGKKFELQSDKKILTKFFYLQKILSEQKKSNRWNDRRPFCWTWRGPPPTWRWSAAGWPPSSPRPPAPRATSAKRSTVRRQRSWSGGSERRGAAPRRRSKRSVRAASFSKRSYHQFYLPLLIT